MYEQLQLPMRLQPRSEMLRNRWRNTPDAQWTAFVRMWMVVTFDFAMTRSAPG
jgi:hypothetical protein